MIKKVFYILLIVSFLLEFDAFSQNLNVAPQDYLYHVETTPNADTSNIKNNVVVIRSITFVGNEKTKKRILLRELSIRVNDTILLEKLPLILKKERNKIFNTELFIVVDAKYTYDSTDASLIDVVFELKERWYLFPVPVFELSDRNLNDWIVNYGGNLNRTNYGLRVVKKNVRGRNETLETLIQNGFTPKYELAYQMPYIEKKQQYGLSFKASYSQNKNVAYQTLANKLIFFKDESVLRERSYINLRLRKRNGFYGLHFLTLEYNQNRISDTLAKLNPNYFLNARTRQKFWEISYEFSEDRRDVTYYPLRGYRFTFGVQKQGIFRDDDLNVLNISGNIEVFKPLSKKLFFAHYFTARWFWNDAQPYYIGQGLGYGNDILRGYQLYVIDGQSYFLSKNTLRYELANTRKEIKWLKVKQFNTLPLAVYPKIFFDAGYVRDNIFTTTNNLFANQLLYTVGAGFDIISYYNLVFQFEYAFTAKVGSSFSINVSGAF